MAETENNQDAEQIAGLPDAEGAEVVAEAAAAEADATPAESAAAPAEAAAAPAEAAPAPAAASAGPTRAERRERAQAERTAKASARAPRTAEERQAERDETRRQKAAARRGERRREREKARSATAERGAHPSPAHEHGPGRPKTRQGVVVSDRAAKTITVRIDTARRHRRYQKIVRTSTTLHAHDEQNEAHIGDTVVVRECRPLSRTKRWRLVEVIERAR